MEHSHYHYKQQHFLSAIKIAVFINLILAVSKIFIGSRDNSHSLIVDGIHSFSDLFSDLSLFWVSLLAHKAPDEDHPYGHERFETLGTVGLGSLLMITAGALVYETIDKLVFHQVPREIPTMATIYMALASIALNEFLYQYTIFKSKKIKSDLLAVNAWHHRTDAISSVVVLIGVLLSWYSYHWLDDIAALIIAVMIAKIGWDYLIQAVKELADKSLDPEKVTSIEATINSIPGIRSAHNLRTRKMGEKTLVDVNIEVDPKITVTEGHEIAAWTAKTLLENYDDIADVTVHIDTENDMTDDFVHEYEVILPLRPTVIEKLKSLSSDIISYEQVKEIRLNYFGKKIMIEFILPLEMQSQKNLQFDLQQRFKQINWFGNIKFLYTNEVMK